MAASANEALPSRRRKRVIAFVFAAGCCVAMFLVSALVKLLPISDGLKEGLVRATLLPLILIARALAFLVDALGPRGLSEPASMYLPGWAIYSLGVLSAVLFVALLYGAALAILSWTERHKRSISPTP